MQILSCLNHYSIVLVTLNSKIVIQCGTTVLYEQDKTRKILTVLLIYSHFQDSLPNAQFKKQGTYTQGTPML